ncbi:MAG: cupin domain-containing protein [Chthoniobacterales bacterium]
MKLYALAASLAFTFAVVVFAADEPTVISSANLKWVDFPARPGTQLAVLFGDPSQPGLFIVRLKMPAGYKIAPHTHPAAENVTIISGAGFLGFGKTVDEKAAREMKTGDFLSIPADSPHYVWTRDETIIQINSMGPFTSTEVNAEAPSPKNP